jgi:hypothetical protein
MRGLNIFLAGIVSPDKAIVLPSGDGNTSVCTHPRDN